MFCGGQLEYKQGGKDTVRDNQKSISFSISFSRACFSVVTELYYSQLHPGETNVWSVSKTGFSAGEQSSGGFFGWYWIAIGI